MTDTSLRISDLTVSATISDTDILEIERAGAAYSVTRALLKGGDVSSSTSSVTDGSVVAFDGTGGKTIKAATTIVATSCSGNAATATLAGKSTNIVGGAAGSIPYQSALDTTAMLPLGTSGQVLRVNSGATAPEFATLSYVGLTGSESIDGVKTFTSFPITPSSAPTSNYQVANKKYVDDATPSLGTLSAGTSGYMNFTNGLIIQWGRATGNITGTTITLPMVFPNAMFVATANVMTNDVPAWSLAVYDLTTSTFKVKATNTASATFNYCWMAIGN